MMNGGSFYKKKYSMNLEPKTAFAMETQILIGGFRSVKPEEIILLQADVNYTVIHFKDGEKFTVATPLKSLQSRLEPFNFYRTHKSFMVNLNCVKSYPEPHKQVQLVDNKQVMVSRRRINGLKKSLLIEC
jgi:two-component system LytT family response regulator